MSGAEFAVNYSPLLGGLVQAGRVCVDRFKCPAWPAVVAEARRAAPVYIHFPLVVGCGRGAPQNTETGAPADLDALARWMDETGTPYINTHFFPLAADFPHIPSSSLEPADTRQVIDAALRDLAPLIRRFGAQRVLVENIFSRKDWLLAGADPLTISRLVEESGCGFLFDLSHARLAVADLGLDSGEYIRQLPLHAMRELHVTGIQVIEGRWLELMRTVQDQDFNGDLLAGRAIDHLPMTAEDWTALESFILEYKRRAEPEPWVVAYEYGGVGGFWKLVGEESIYLDHLPRLQTMLKGLS